MSFLFGKEMERLLYTPVHEKTIQLANYLMRFSFSEFMEAGASEPEKEKEMTIYRLTLLLYFAEGLSYMERGKTLIQDESFEYGGNIFPGATIELPSIRFTWGTFRNHVSLNEELHIIYQYSLNWKLDEFVKESLPIEKLTGQEKRLLESIWTEFKDLPTKQMAESVVESAPYVQARERFARVERGHKVYLDKNDIREDFLSLKHGKE